MTNEHINGMFLYSAVSSPLDRSKRVTLHHLADLFIPIPTRLLCMGSILGMQQLRAKNIHSHFHHHL